MNQSEVGSVIVSVPRPSRRRSLTAGSNIPYTTARSRSSSNPFSSSGASWVPAVLHLTETTVFYEVQDGEQRCDILLEDLVGVHICPNPLLSDGRACQVDIHMFPVFTKKFSKKKIRRLADISILFDKEKNFNENFEVASKWKHRILTQADIAARNIFEQSDREEVKAGFTSNGTDELSESSRRSRNLMVFINPMAGVQRGEASFYSHVKPMFDLAEITYEVKVTGHQNHAHEMIQTLDLSAVDGIVIGSGDGLLYEIMNGIMKRPDWERIIKIPIGMLPLGSGNALVASTLHEANELFSLEMAAFQIIRGGYSPLDLTTVHTSDGGKSYMTLLGAWGLVADVDIESEKMRRIGEARFLLGSLNALRKKKVYRGRLSYLAADSSSTEPKTIAVESVLINRMDSKELGSSGIALLGSSEFTDQDNLGADSAGESRKECAAVDSLPSSSTDSNLPGFNIVGASDVGERSSSLGFGSEETSIGAQHCCSDSPSHSGQSYTTCQGGNSSTEQVQGSNLAPQAQDVHTSSTTVTSYKSIQQNLQGTFPQPSTDLLVSLDSPLPETWTTLEDNFLSLSFLSIPFLSRANVGDLNVQVGSGKISLVWIDGGASRLDTLKVIINASSGKHVEMEQVKVIDVVAFRIEPMTPEGIMTIDGEVVSYGPMQAQIHPHMAYVMSRKRRQ